MNLKAERDGSVVGIPNTHSDDLIESTVVLIQFCALLVRFWSGGHQHGPQAGVRQLSVHVLAA